MASLWPWFGVTCSAHSPFTTAMLAILLGDCFYSDTQGLVQVVEQREKKQVDLELGTVWVLFLR